MIEIEENHEIGMGANQVLHGSPTGINLENERNGMGWFRRKSDGGREPGQRFSTVTEGCLRRAGWEPGRSCALAPLEEPLRTVGLPFHRKARDFLQEFYRLQVTVPIDGFPDFEGFVDFSPEAVLRFLNPKTELPNLKALIPNGPCPIGTTSGHTVSIFMDEAGASYLIDMDWNLFAKLARTPDDAVEVLCDGRNGRVDSVILADGKPTKAVLTEMGERRHWRIEEFPDLVDCLPPTSLSPGRRPPTWRPMLQTAQDLIRSDKIPRDRFSKVMITCGGFAQSSSGQPYFVAHCENSRYVRQKAGFRVSSPPPGIPSEHRVGESIPFTPPAGW